MVCHPAESHQPETAGGSEVSFRSEEREDMSPENESSIDAVRMSGTYSVSPSKCWRNFGRGIWLHAEMTFEGNTLTLEMLLFTVSGITKSLHVTVFA